MFSDYFHLAMRIKSFDSFSNPNINRKLKTGVVSSQQILQLPKIETIKPTEIF